MSVWVEFEFLRLHLYRSVIHLISLVFDVAPILIDHLPCQFEFSSRTYIDWSSFILVCVQFESGSHPYRSVIFLSIHFQFELRSYLYRLVIFPSVQFNLVWVSGTTPILIGHHSSCWFVFEFLGSHLYRSAISHQFSLSFRDRTYINWSFIRFIGLSLHLGTAPISIGHFPCQFEFEFF